MNTHRLQSWINPLIQPKIWIPPALVALTLVIISRYNYLMFHTLAESFAIIIAFVMFTLAWSTRDFALKSFQLHLACGYFWVAILDLIHTLAFEGLHDAAVHSDHVAGQLWSITRAFEALLLLTAPFAIGKRRSNPAVFGAFGVIAMALAALVLTGNVPQLYSESHQVTTSKILGEYLILTLFALAAIALVTRGETISQRTKSLVATAIFLSIISQLFFSVHMDTSGQTNLTRHILKLFSIWLIFHAIVISHLQELLQALNKSSQHSASLFENVEISIWDEDFTGVIKILDALRISGVTDLRAHLEKNQEVLRQIAGSLKVLRVNNATLKLYEADHPDDLLKTFNRNLMAELPPILIEEMCAIWERRTVFRQEASFPTLSGKMIHAIVAFQVPDTPEKWRNVPVSIIDITDLKQAEQRLLEARDDAEKANRTKSEFLASMSHELRTPMNAILGFAQILRSNTKHPLSEDQHTQVGHILDGGNHLLDLINQVLDLARIEADQIDLMLTKFNVNEIVSECITLSESLGEERRITIIDQLSDGPEINLRSDPVRVKQILFNLLSNAVKYNQAGGTVTVTGYTTDRNFLHVSVKDTGPGIAEKDREDIFRAFYRLQATTDLSIEGTGIGLNVTRLLIEKMAGRIGFHSEVGVGSTFWIELPLASNDEVLIWDGSLRVGIDPIDKDHQLIMALVNKVCQRSYTDEDLTDLITQLGNSLTYHFHREEAIMAACNFPALDKHIDGHRKLTARYNKLVGAWSANPTRDTLQHLKGFLYDWYIGHIVNADKDISEYTSNHSEAIRQALEAVMPPTKVVDLIPQSDNLSILRTPD